MTRFNTVRVLAGTMAILAVGACKDLEVTNPNNPNIERAVATPEDVQNLAISSVNSWYLTTTFYRPFAMFAVTSDMLTANFGNFGMRFNNLEPRIAFENNSAGGDKDVAEDPWEGNYATLGAANDVIRAIDGGIDLGGADTEMYRSFALFAQAASLSNLALIFDQAFVTDESYVVGESAEPTLQPYSAVLDFAMSKWDLLDAATSTGSEEYGDNDLPLQAGALTTESLNRIANSMAAWTLANGARNSAENATTDWSRVLAYAEKGISGPNGRGPALDFTVIGDNNTWYSYVVLYGDFYSWMKVDMRLMCRLDPSQPCTYTGTVPPASTGPDARILSDITFDKVIGDPNRGIYMQSPYHHSRYESYSFRSSTSAEGPAPFMLQAENDLLIAEGLVRTGGDIARAADLINKTRVGRGHLAPAAAGDGATALLDKIIYERDIETLVTNGGEFYSRRRIDGLQAGTPRHLPIPALELETLKLPIYTFGGSGADMVIITPSGEEIGIRKPIHRPFNGRTRWLKPQM